MAEQTKDIRDYLAILKTRKKVFLAMALTVLLVSTAVAVLLPAIYESSSTILIEEQQIPPEFVRSTVTGFADQRIQSLTQQILSRTRLWEIIQQFNLYPEMREKYTREEIIELMRGDIIFNTIGAEVGDKRSGGGRIKALQGPAVTIAFTVAYRGKNPETVLKVASTLASLYLEQNLKTREAQAQSTTQFLQAELKELEERIRVLGTQITAFKEKHEGIQPELQTFNMSQAERLESELKQLDINIRSVEDRKIYLEAQLATAKPDTPVISSTGERVMDPASRLHVLQVHLAELQSKFSEDHPDIRKTRREMAEMEKLVNQKGGSASLRRQKLTNLKAELGQKQGKYSDEHPDIRKLKNEIQRLEQETEKPRTPIQVTDPENPAYISLMTQVKAADNDMAALRQQRTATKEKVQMYRQRLEETPKVEQEYLALTRDYDNAKHKYQEVMNKILEARISEGMEEHQKGEKFTLIDPATYPEKPVSPKRLLIFLAGVILSLGAGVGMVALTEHLDHSVKSPDELFWVTGLPVLGTIIRIETQEDLAQKLRRRKLIWGITSSSLVLGIILFHFLYMDLWVLTARLLRIAKKYT